MDDLEWYIVERQDVPRALHDLGYLRRNCRRSVNHVSDSFVSLLIGVNNLIQHTSWIQPYLMVIPDHLAADALSWIHTYAENVGAISSHCPVVSSSELRMLQMRAPSVVGEVDRQFWTALMLGEMLAIKERGRSLMDVPLSAFTASGALALARFTSRFGTDPTGVHQLIERMGKISDQGHYAPIFVDPSLLMRCSQLFRPLDANYFRDPGVLFSAKIDRLVEVFLDFNAHEDGQLVFILSQLLRGELRSDSAEIRVRGFDLVVQLFETALDRNEVKGIDLTASAVALACFLVGRSTSHFSLIDKMDFWHFRVPVYFGVVAGLFGADYWSADWGAVSRKVNPLLSLGEAVEFGSFDLSWVEFEWLSEVVPDRVPLLQGPRLNLRSLTVDIFPGVPLSLRFDSHRSGASNLHTPSLGAASIAAISQAIYLLESIVKTGPKKKGPSDETLELPLDDPPSRRKARTKKTSR